MTKRQRPKAGQARPCKACGGTGCSAVDPQSPYRGPWLAHAECRESAANRCPTCYGSGQVEESIPASDAIADAETVRRIVAPFAAAEVSGPVVELYNIAATLVWSNRAAPGLRG